MGMFWRSRLLCLLKGLTGNGMDRWEFGVVLGYD